MGRVFIKSFGLPHPRSCRRSSEIGAGSRNKLSKTVTVFSVSLPISGSVSGVRTDDARIARLRKRMAAGDPDITPDELRAALDLAEYKRRELAQAKPTDISEGAKLLTLLPNAAELYRRQIALGLDGAHPQIRAKARLAIRELLGQIRLEPGCGRPTKCIQPCWCAMPYQGLPAEGLEARPPDYKVGR